MTNSAFTSIMNSAARRQKPGFPGSSSSNNLNCCGKIDLGDPVSPQFPSYRVWRVLIGRVSVVDIGYLVAEELQDIEMSFILKVENDEPPSSKIDKVDKLIEATRLVATLAKIVRDIFMFST